MLNSKQGGVFTVLQFPYPWPPHTISRLLHVQQESATLELYAEPDGTLVFAFEDGQTRFEHHTQRVDLTGPGWTTLSAGWISNSVELHVGGEALLSFELAKGASKVIRTTEHPIGADPAWRDADAPAACARWVEWRARTFGDAKQKPRPERRLKTQEEQVQELLRATHILHDLSALIQQGHAHLLGHLAAELRALIYWNGRSYDPLLLRLAARAGTPLPIYIISDDPPPVSGWSFHVRRGEPSIVKTVPTQIVVDLQHWLESAVFSANGSAELGRGAGESLRQLTVKDLIAGVADTLGAAHYDQDLPWAVESLSKIQGPVSDEVTLDLLVAASLIGPLSQYVVTTLSERSAPT
jgi:hypothetical protein